MPPGIRDQALKRDEPPTMSSAASKKGGAGGVDHVPDVVAAKLASLQARGKLGAAPAVATAPGVAGVAGSGAAAPPPANGQQMTTPSQRLRAVCLPAYASVEEVEADTGKGVRTRFVWQEAGATGGWCVLGLENVTGCLTKLARVSVLHWLGRNPRPACCGLRHAAGMMRRPRVFMRNASTGSHLKRRCCCLRSA